MLVDSGKGLGAEVTALEQRTDQDLTDVTSQVRERAVTCQCGQTQLATLTNQWLPELKSGTCEDDRSQSAGM